MSERNSKQENKNKGLPTAKSLSGCLAHSKFGNEENILNLITGICENSHSNINLNGDMLEAVPLKEECLGSFLEALILIPVGRILGFHCHGPGSIPGQGTDQVAWHSQKRKKKFKST